MANLKSNSFEVSTTRVEYSTVQSKTLMPLSDGLRVWYGKFIGTDSELLAKGMPIPAGKLLEHVMMHDGILTFIAETGTVVMHEVV